MAANEYPQLYTCSHGEAEQCGETELWEKSFREKLTISTLWRASVLLQ